MAPLSGMTSQPNLNALVECLRFTPTRHRHGLRRCCKQTARLLGRRCRKYYLPFETGQLAPSADVYRHEMPGGQYTNLYQQAQVARPRRSRWREVCRMYAEVNQLFGDIVKVTPTSKVVGDMALFMVANNLTPDEVPSGTRELAFPESVVEFFEGKLGQPPAASPRLQERVSSTDASRCTDRPGASLPPADFEGNAQEARERKA